MVITKFYCISYNDSHSDMYLFDIISTTSKGVLDRLNAMIHGTKLLRFRETYIAACPYRNQCGGLIINCISQYQNPSFHITKHWKNTTFTFIM